MKNEFSPMFERTYIGDLGVRNRLVMAPMGLGQDSDGTIGDMGLDYYGARARGGTGMLILGWQNVTNKTDPFIAGFRGVDTAAQQYGWARLADRVKAYGTALCVQLTCGLGSKSRPIPGQQNVAASVMENWYEPGTYTRALGTDEVKALPAAFGRAAARAKAANVDAIEIHGHFGYTIDTFMSAQWNKREDEYGGSFVNRMRLVTEIYQAMRAEVGAGFPIWIRMVLDHKTPEGRKKEDSFDIIRYLDKLGLDAFSLDEGSYAASAYSWCFPTVYMGEAPMAYVGDLVRPITKKPVLTVGSYTPESALKAVTEGSTDFVLIGRGLLADHEYANKLYYGRREDLRPCIRCNEYCLNKAISARPRCSVNAACGYEVQLKLTKSDSPKRVVVVGGGPGGLEASHVAATKGHDVILYEKSDKLGGQFVAASAPRFKSPLRAFLEYQKTQNEKLGVDIRLNTEITGDSPELAEAEHIIVALGAHPIIPDIKGVNGPKILEVAAAHVGDRSRIGQKVLIIGGGLSGLDCAIELAMEGKDCTILKRSDVILPGAPLANRYSIMEMLHEYKIKLLTGHKVIEFTDKGVKVDVKGEVKELEADTVILAFGTLPNRKIAKEILDRYPCAVAVGDCTGVGQVGEAVRAGFFAGWAID